LPPEIASVAFFNDFELLVPAFAFAGLAVGRFALLGGLQNDQ
jgi:hypothetical protein